MRLSKDAQTQQSYIDFPMVTGERTIMQACWQTP